MIRRITLMFFLQLTVALACYGQDSSDLRLRDIIAAYGQAQVTIQYTSREQLQDLTLNVSVLSVKDDKVYISLSPLTVGWFVEKRFKYTIIEQPSSRQIESAKSVKGVSNWDSYPTYSQYDSIMRGFVKQYPLLCRLDTIGKSVNGKLVLALRITGNASSGTYKPDVFYTSTMHGDETVGYVLMLRLADYLLRNYPAVTRVKRLMDNLTIWINPLANPDGTYGTGNTITSPTRYNANGYDLNRNFPDPITPNTIKQPETLDMMRFMSKHKFVLSANFHSGAEVVNYPWDRYYGRLHADNDWFLSLGRAYADTVHTYSGSGYMNFLNNGVTRGALWYIVYGGRQDYMTGDLHGREITIELDDQFVTPGPQLPLFWQYNWRSFLGYLENATYGIHGVVRDAVSKQPVAAVISITGYDKDGSEVYSDTLGGTFTRFLNPGTWTLTVTASGYQPLIMNNIQVSAFKRTDIIAELSTKVTGVEEKTVRKPVAVYPNPARTKVSAVLPDNFSGQVKVNISTITGKRVIDFNAQIAPGSPLEINTGGLAPDTYLITISIPGKYNLYYGKFIRQK